MNESRPLTGYSKVCSGLYQLDPLLRILSCLLWIAALRRIIELIPEPSQTGSLPFGRYVP